MGRQSELLLEVAKCFEDMRSPFDGEWLAEHSVTLNEAGDLSEAIANAIRLWVKSPARTRVDSVGQDVLSGAAKVR